MKKIAADEIILRALEPADVDVLYRWENDPEIWHVSNTYTAYSKYILEKYVENSHLDIYQVKQLRLMIDLQNEATGDAHSLGTIDLFDFDPYHNRAGIGILIGAKVDRNKGYAEQALRKFIDYCFNTLQLHQLYCNISEGNESSLKLFKKCGFILAARKKDWVKTPGKYMDEWLLQLINPMDQSRKP
jgi:diamine N-acetyltransferase